MKKSFFNKTILGNFVFINEENSKEIQGKKVLSFTKFVLGGFWLGGAFVREFMSRGVCPDTTFSDPGTNCHVIEMPLSKHTE